MSGSFTVRVPATSANIGPGFDCLGVALDLYLTIECTPSDGFSMELRGEGSDRLAKDGRNLLARCVASGYALASRPDFPTTTATKERASDSPPHASTHRESATSVHVPHASHSKHPILPSVKLEINNHIPLARGLGSSSAAIVGGLATGLLLAKRERDDRSELTAEERRMILSEATRIEGHPDNVAPAALGDLVICGVEQGEVITIPQSWPEPLELVAVIPELAVRTEAARRALPATIPHADAVANGARLARLLGALQTGRFEHLASALRDRLHQPYRLPLATGLSDVLSTLEQETRSLGAYLSGSGPTIIALCTTGSMELGEAGVREFANHGVAATYRVLHVDSTGVTTAPLARRSNENAQA